MLFVSKILAAAGVAALLAASPAHAEVLPPTGQTIAGPALVDNPQGGTITVFESTVAINVCVTLSNASDSSVNSSISLAGTVRSRVLAPFKAYSFCSAGVTKALINVGLANAYYRVDKF